MSFTFYLKDGAFLTKDGEFAKSSDCCCVVGCEALQAKGIPFTISWEGCSCYEESSYFSTEMFVTGDSGYLTYDSGVNAWTKLIGVFDSVSSEFYRLQQFAGMGCDILLTEISRYGPFYIMAICNPDESAPFGATFDVSVYDLSGYSSVDDIPGQGNVFFAAGVKMDGIPVDNTIAFCTDSTQIGQSGQVTLGEPV